MWAPAFEPGERSGDIRGEHHEGWGDGSNTIGVVDSRFKMGCGDEVVNGVDRRVVEG